MNTIEDTERTIAEGIKNGDHPKTIAMKLLTLEAHEDLAAPESAAAHIHETRETLRNSTYPGGAPDSAVILSLATQVLLARRAILAAAAKIVKESGAVEALADAQSDIPGIRIRAGWKMEGRRQAYAKALLALRALTETGEGA